MPSKRALLGVCIVLGVAIPALAVPGPSADDLERNRRLLETWRNDPEHYARLKRDLKAFWDRPALERERLRALDHDVRQTDPRTQKHLLGVMERYADWLERLPEADRQQIATAAHSERINVIRAVRDRRYLEGLPSKTREELAQLPTPERHAQLERLRADDRRLRKACTQLALVRLDIAPTRPAQPTLPTLFRPTKLEEFPPDVRYYVDTVLWRQISADEADQLKKAEGAPWPLLAKTILELSGKHPVKLPGPVTGPRRYVELPSDVLKAMPMKDLQPAQKKHLGDVLGRWPEFASEFSLLARKNGIALPRQLGPCHPKQFDGRVGQFIERTLQPKLTDDEKTELKAAEGKWPEYPRLILDLSKKHGLDVPLMRLPGPRELWDQAKVT
jgi:hypothetical protein